MSRHPPLNAGYANSTGLKGYYVNRALRFTGIAAKNAGDYFEDFASAASATATAPADAGAFTGGSPTASNRPTGLKAGFKRLASSATSGSSIDIDLITMAITNQGTDPWYVVARVAIPTAYDSAGKAHISMHNVGGTKSYSIGVFGSISTTNYVVQYDGTYASPGSTIDTGVAFSATPVVLELYCRGDSVLRWRVAEGDETTVTMASAATDGARIVYGVRNGATAADRQMDLDFIGCVFGR